MRAGILVLALLACAACSTAPGTAPTSGAGAGNLPAAAKVDYQIGGAYPPAADARIVERDRTDKPVKGRYNICYLNAFQTQPDETPSWRKDHDSLLLRDAAGNYVVDREWNETLLDISTPESRTELLAVISPWIDTCTQDGFDAAELDNLDSYTRSNGRLTAADAIEFSAALAHRAHAQGLAVAQKNAPALAAAREDTGFDFAIVEECQANAECELFTKVYDSAMIEIEYSEPAFRAACAARGTSVSIVLRDRGVLPAGRPGYLNRYCGA